jgi:hypothetical protein
MIDKLAGAYCCEDIDETSFLEDFPPVLTLAAPQVEEIARAIWQRQHDSLDRSALSYNAKWRDQSIPTKFWDEFVSDARVVLLLLYKKHTQYQNASVCPPIHAANVRMPNR